jgi:hypothetical protein
MLELRGMATKARKGLQLQHAAVATVHYHYYEAVF